MSGFGKPASANKTTAGTVLISDLNVFEPSLIEKQRHPHDVITPAVLRLANGALAAGVDVVLLSRCNTLDGRGLAKYLDLVRSFLPHSIRERISISTAHKYKGLEKPMVILLDVVARNYPLIHPRLWPFFRPGKSYRISGLQRLKKLARGLCSASRVA
jgi:DNA helicase IV